MNDNNQHLIHHLIRHARIITLLLACGCASVADGGLSSIGANLFFILEPGWFLVLEGKDGEEDARLTITVLDQTRRVAGVETRVVEEREEVDIYEDGKIVSLDETLATPAGLFTGVLKTLESSHLEAGEEFKYYAAGIGLIREENLFLTKYGRGVR